MQLFIQRALSPAKVTSITLNPEEHKAEVYLQPEEVSLAIGKGGLNIKLASMLTEFTIDVFRVVNEGEADEYIYLDDFCVSAKYRGKGLGTALVRTAEKYAEDKNVPAAVLHVEKSNEGAYRLYKRLGYEVCADEGCRLRMKKDLM